VGTSISSFNVQRSRFEKALNVIGKTGFPVGRSFALIAGVTQYPNFPPLERSLRPAAVDIEKLQAYLKEQEFFDEIVVLKDGDMTLPNLNYFLENYFPEHLAQSPHSRFLFAYSGHGYSVKAGSVTVPGRAVGDTQRTAGCHFGQAPTSSNLTLPSQFSQFRNSLRVTRSWLVWYWAWHLSLR
jgi:hypothetical protein